jgi:CubicO group peptidase (beta-lactamase class C family)
MKVLQMLAAAAVLTAFAPAAASAGDAGAPPVQTVVIHKGRIDSLLQHMVADGRVVGVEALVWKHGREAYYGEAGLADREAGRRMRRDAVFQLYSMTKPVTGVAMMQLWEQGKFRLDDPVAKYLPEFADVRVYAGTAADGGVATRAPSRPILIRDLMRHTAGLGSGSGDSAPQKIFSAADPLALTNTLPEMSRKVARLPLLFDPGEQWSYSAAVDVQAALVEKLSGQPFETYVRAHIFDPLKMKDAAWTQPDANLARFAASYDAADPKRGLTRVGAADERAHNFDRSRKLAGGGAGLAAPIDDYMRFARMLLGGGELDGVRILKASTVRLMATDQLDPVITERLWLPSKGSVGFGLDFAVRTSRPATPKENRGAVGEFFWDGYESTLFWVDPANDLAAVFLVQKRPFDGTLHHDFREAVYGADYLGPEGAEAR